MKIGTGDAKEVAPMEVQCVPCGTIWTMLPTSDLYCPKCRQSYLRSPPIRTLELAGAQVSAAPSAVGITGGNT